MRFLALLAAPALLIAEELPAVVPPADAPQWVVWLVSVLGTLITAVLVPYLNQKASAARAEAAKVKIDTAGSLIEQKAKLYELVKAQAWTLAANFAERRIPQIAAKVLAGQLKTADAIKVELRALGADLRVQVVTWFAEQQGINIVAALGDQALDSLIEWVANKVSPFPGAETAKVLLKDKVSNMLVERGVEYVRARWLKVSDDPMHAE